ncbi:lysophospholipid acyltransferase family protein [Antrihabitans spumae]|uniref:Lysophospholipid acyltransferase family protein n=1 Tax=Antrihabitans spumae TaxID=3373370 RepID=A0ABW7KIA7_9NOCA
MTVVEELAFVETPETTQPQHFAHAWMPGSPCDAACVDTDSVVVGDLEFATRLAGVATVLLSFPVVSVVTPTALKSTMQRRYAHALLRCCGMRLRVIDERGDASPGRIYARPDEGVLIVSGHVGWTDIIAIAAVQPVSFVARADLIDWPVLGLLARKMRVVPIDRARLRTLPDVIRQIADRITAGERITAFPEGTTWCGRAYGTLRPALFQAAIDTNTAVQPIRLQYRNEDGSLSTTPSFIGDDSMVASLLRMLRSRGITAEIVLAPVEHPGTDRRDLAARCERAVRGQVELDFAAHGVLESEEARNTHKTPVPAVETVAATAQPVARIA